MTVHLMLEKRDDTNLKAVRADLSVTSLLTVTIYMKKYSIRGMVGRSAGLRVLDLFYV